MAASDLGSAACQPTVDGSPGGHHDLHEFPWLDYIENRLGREDRESAERHFETLRQPPAQEAALQSRQDHPGEKEQHGVGDPTHPGVRITGAIVESKWGQEHDADEVQHPVKNTARMYAEICARIRINLGGILSDCMEHLPGTAGLFQHDEMHWYCSTRSDPYDLSQSRPNKPFLLSYGAFFLLCYVRTPLWRGMVMAKFAGQLASYIKQAGLPLRRVASQTAFPTRRSLTG